MKKRLVFFSVLLGGLLSVCAQGTTNWYVDAVNGNDSTGDGSYTNAYRTITNLWPELEAGDTVGLFGGDYGGFDYYTSHEENPADIFTNWVTFKGLDSENPPVFEYIHMGLGIGNVPLDPLKTGPPTAQADAWLAFENLTITDGVYLGKLRYIRIKNCLITLDLDERFLNIDPDFPGEEYEENIEREAVEFKRVEHVYLEQCEITDTAHGMTGNGMDINIISNEIHHVRHDGIRVWGYWNSRIEGNNIYNSDTFLTDEESQALYEFARHADTIHIGISGTGPFNTNVVIRNNRLYDSVGGHIQMNTYGSGTNELINYDFLFEGNIFSPGNGLHNRSGCGRSGPCHRHGQPNRLEISKSIGRFWRIVLQKGHSQSGLPLRNLRAN